MIALSIRPKVDETGGMPELQGRDAVRVENMTITSLSAGLQSGKPSVAVVIDLPDGRYVMAETSLALFLTAADALKAAHGDPRVNPG